MLLEDIEHVDGQLSDKDIFDSVSHEIENGLDIGQFDPEIINSIILLFKRYEEKKKQHKNLLEDMGEM